MCEVMDQINQCTVEWDVSDRSTSPTYVCTSMHVHTYVHAYVCLMYVCT